MLILGIEAAAKVAGACLLEDGAIVCEIRECTGLTHSETLLPMIHEVLEKAGRRVKDLDYIALTHGPGSFTGLRIGAATAKGLALSHHIPLLSVSTLEAACYVGGLGSLAGSGEKPFLRVSMMDARRSQVYAGVYGPGKGGALNEILLAPEALSVQELAGFLEKQEGSAAFFGDAAAMYQVYFQNLLGRRFVAVPGFLQELSAGKTASLAYDALRAGTLEPISGSDFSLEYLRKSQAEREREERMRESGVEEEAHE